MPKLWRKEVIRRYADHRWIGCIQAAEVIKYIVGTDELLIYDGLDLQFTELKIKKDPNGEHCGYLGGKE